MEDIKFFLNGNERTPKNWSDVEFQFDFRNRNIRQLELSVNELEFVREAYTEVKDYVNNYGYFYAMPARIRYTNGNEVDYMIDFSDEAYRERINSITAPIKLRKGSDTFFDKADALGFGVVNWIPSDFNECDYLVVKDNQISYFIMLGLTTYNLSVALAETARSISQGVIDTIETSVPVGIPPGPDWGAIATIVLKTLLKIAYAILITLALVKLIIEIIESIFPPLRQLKCIQLKKLIEKSCSHIGYTLKSELLDSLPNLHILPTPTKAKNPTLFQELIIPSTLALTDGYPTSKDTVKTLGQLIEAVETIFNAKTRVYNGEIRIENEDYFINNAGQNVNLSFNIQDSLENEKSINSTEISKRMYTYYLEDMMDINTLDNTTGTVYEVSSELKNSPDKDLELITGNDRINIPFSRGTRKGDLNFIEKIIKGVAQAIDNFAGTGYASKINNRKNALQVSNQYFSVTKLIWMQGSGISQNQNSFIGAKAILDYHNSRLIENNQKDVYENMPLPLTQEELFNLLQNNFVNLNDGKVAEIEYVNWSEKTYLATVSYTVKRESKNEKTIIINNGNE